MPPRQQQQLGTRERKTDEKNRVSPYRGEKRKLLYTRVVAEGTRRRRRWGVVCVHNITKYIFYIEKFALQNDRRTREFIKYDGVYRINILVVRRRFQNRKREVTNRIST